MSYRRCAISLAATALAFTLAAGQGFGNGITLTATGVADGFSLTTFATLNPGDNSFGSFGIAVASNGNIIVSNYPNNTRYVFSDTDGQTPASALFTQTGSGSSTVAYATAGGQAYGGVNGRLVQFNSDGTVNHILTGVTSTDLGMWGNPVNGHIIATSGAGLIDIDPLANSGAGSFRVINASGNGDGVSVSPDGKTAYVEQGSEINGYDIATGAEVFTSGPLVGLSSADGSGVISSTNSLNGDIVVNFNGGGIGLIVPSTKAFTVIADGGNRGDYVSPDTNNGTLFLDYSDTVERLSCGANCSIGGPPPPPTTTPEPGSLVLLGTGLLGFAALIYRRQKGVLGLRA